MSKLKSNLANLTSVRQRDSLASMAYVPIKRLPSLLDLGFEKSKVSTPKSGIQSLSFSHTVIVWIILKIPDLIQKFIRTAPFDQTHGQ